MDFLPNREDYLQPLRMVSLDKAKGVSLIDADDLVYNFDGIAKHLYEELQRKEPVASCDALLNNGEQYYFFEFKNQTQKKVERSQMAKKAFQSFNLFRLAIEQELSVDETRDHSTLFVIYADEGGTESFQSFRDKMCKLAKMPGDESILFDLRAIEGKLYRKIHTVSASDFMMNWYGILFPTAT